MAASKGTIRSRFLLLVLATVLVASNAGADAPDRLSVVDPFATQTAVDNFKKANRPTDPNQQPDFDRLVGQIGRIARVSYRFDPSLTDDTPTLPNTATATIYRTVDVNVPELSTAAIEQAIESNNSDTCESTTSISNVSIHYTDMRHITITAHIFHRERNCGSFLGIHYQKEKGEGDADATLEYYIDDTFTPAAMGPPVLSNIRKRGSSWGLLEFLFPISIPIEEVLTSTFKADINLSLASSLEVAKSVIGDGRFVALTSGVTSIQDYERILDLTDFPVLQLATDMSKSGLSLATETAPVFEIVQSGHRYGRYINDSLKQREAEIQTLRDYAEAGPERVVISKGDSLIRLLKARHLDPRMHLLVEDYNRLRSGRIHPGQQILIPRLWYIAYAVNQCNTLVLPGDNLASIKAKRGAAGLLERHERRSRNPNLIYPYENVFGRGWAAP